MAFAPTPKPRGSRSQLAPVQTGTELFSETWSLWLDRSQRCASTSQFTASLRRVYTLSSMQVLGVVCDNILPVSELADRYSYHFMLGQRRPVWEDEENSRGGTWSFRCAKADTETVWRVLLEALVSGSLDYCVARGDRLVGLSVGNRNADDVVHLWNIDADRARRATVVDTIIGLLPKITFRSVLYKPFEGKQVNSQQPPVATKISTPQPVKKSVSFASVDEKPRPIKKTNENAYKKAETPKQLQQQIGSAPRKLSSLNSNTGY